ncbi:hypothetical protein A2U01_0010032 [Trifolium medium]|uniref:Uncharacterized protein n=1 Tax=Trifolium medium TaxID=97028 RepID=A0A392MQ85_9FABA|nr:hypothetical protein [Trifolium medium]
MSLRRNHHLQLQRVLRKGRRLEVLFQKMEMPMVLTSHKEREDLLNDPRLKKNLQRNE